MQFYSWPEERRVTISSVESWEVMKFKGSNRRFSYRSVLPSVLIAGMLLPFLFIRVAFLALDAGASVRHPISCLGWRFRPTFLGGSDASREFAMELRRVYVEGAARGGYIDEKVTEAAPDSLDDLIAELSSSSSYQQLDIKTFVLKTKAMLMKMDHKVQLARLQALFYGHLASIGIPKSLQCLSLRLTEEYLANAIARSSLPPPEYASCLTNDSYIHFALITDNVLAAAVVVSSTVISSADPEKIVFHIITDKKTYAAMHAWFALNPVPPAIVEVKGLHQYDWPDHVNDMVMGTVEEIHQSSSAYQYFSRADEEYGRLEALKPSTFSVLNYLRIHLPELFPKLGRVILLDDDIVVQRDLTPLWDLNLNGNVLGAVSAQVSDEGGDRHCIEKKLSDYLNFSNPMISSLASNGDQCAWLSGMTICDLQAWRWTNITQAYQHWLQHNRESGFVLCQMGSLPPALIAFNGHVHPIEPSWHLSGLGSRMPAPELLESAAVVHFSGPRKPWLEIGYPALRELWRAHLNHSNEFIRHCRVVK
ncbi:probable galacturonosyltransferase 15 isoform X2 [Elaeis guineensis]|uniref:probable galacturonosyltransferase 15 isoform X2 n=1 Tax=Elaeis guineensis var. tenera TaxID=51953 RepID=UPI003C6D607F